jgi:hypothetical protein
VARPGSGSSAPTPPVLRIGWLPTDVTSRLGSVDRSGAVGAAGKLPASVRVVGGRSQVRWRRISRSR